MLQISIYVTLAVRADLRYPFLARAQLMWDSDSIGREFCCLGKDLRALVSPLAGFGPRDVNERLAF